ncbi:MAG: Lrp/AsnC family transcriptional regulator [Anaerolineales bacterium]|nr:Lrp/AsnC family transcriptional regulator [Anaerolineales bacterium]MCB9430449.1 Lrp/AsnC family transcriptional regulator [Ardenticatenaceae bacterium]
MDKLDRAILAHLQKDGRKPFTKIAKDLNITEGTVRNRVARLLETQAVQIIGLVNPHQAGYEAPAMIGVSIHPPLLGQAADQIVKLPEVSYLIMVSGEFDLLVEVLCRDRAHLASFIRDTLLQIPGVQRTQTSFILHTYKMAQDAPVLATPENLKAIS